MRRFAGTTAVAAQQSAMVNLIGQPPGHSRLQVNMPGGPTYPNVKSESFVQSSPALTVD
jgi:hypothetical protein